MPRLSHSEPQVSLWGYSRDPEQQVGEVPSRCSWPQQVGVVCLLCLPSEDARKTSASCSSRVRGPQLQQEKLTQSLAPSYTRHRGRKGHPAPGSTVRPPRPGAPPLPAQTAGPTFQAGLREVKGAPPSLRAAPQHREHACDSEEPPGAMLASMSIKDKASVP